MENNSQELFRVNSDVITLIKVTEEIGWSEIRQSTIHRLIYLSSVLSSFIDKNRETGFQSYHFSLSQSGPYSEIIERSVLDLQVRDVLYISPEGNLQLNSEIIINKKLPLSDKLDWFRVIIYILGVYGESKIFGFVLQDPQYKEDFQTNSQMELDISDQNKTVEFLSQFTKTFEETIDDVSQISAQEYLELYFEYIFSKIIRKEA
ncbi:MAG: hypothetical protein AAGG59_04225 [Bacteroidota bacterium]